MFFSMNLAILNYETSVRNTSLTLRINKFYCWHENAPDDLDTPTGNGQLHREYGAPSVVRVVRNVDSQLAGGDLSCRRKLLIHNKFITNISRRPVKSRSYSPLTPGISRYSC
jgi:hypothetical protein